MTIPLTITDATTAATLRSSLLTTIFGGPLPSTLPTPVSVSSPVAGLPACQRLDLTGFASSWLWTPPGATQLVIVHQGHLWVLDGSGDTTKTGDMIRDFYRAGYAVLAPLMPPANQHNGSLPLSGFLLPTIAGINYFDSSSVWMTGISGGGWTAVLAAAIDPRIVASAPVCGSLPWYMSTDRDWEQNIPARLGIDYPDLYALGGLTRQLQINVDSDAVTSFNLATFRNREDYRGPVADLVTSLGGNWWMRWVNQPEHSYTQAVRREVYEYLTGRPFPYSQIRDSTTATRVGSWSAPQYSSLWVNGNSFSHPAGTAAQYCEWSLDVAPGTVDLWASCNAHTNRATDAPYRIFDGSTQIGEVRINLELTPAFSFDGVGFHYIGRFTFVDTLKVRLCADANEYVVADAIRALPV